jgi:sulfate/thiosulfate transport system permease protein
VVGVATAWVSIIVLLPVAALVYQAKLGGWSGFWTAITSPDAVAALKLTLGVAFVLVVINAIFGTLIAWMLVRDSFPGLGVINTLIDLPFALPTIVAGLVLLILYGPGSPLGIDIAFTRTAVLVALLFETLPFVVRSVQPVLMELDREMEEAAASLGAHPIAVFRRVVLPTLVPSILSGCGLAFAKAIGEFGSVSLISGNLPFSTQVMSVLIYGQIESDNVAGAAALSIALLVIALIVLLLMGVAQRWGMRHEDAA